MGPRSETETEKDVIPTEDESGDISKDIETIPKASPMKHKIYYTFVTMFSYFHISGLYGLYLCFTSAKWMTIGFAFTTYILAMLGIMAGAHRLWSHKSYKAKLPLQIILMLFNSIAFQNSVITWARDHRVHHKCSDTDGDPHNANRGFFFSHIGYLMVRKCDEVKKQGKSIDLSDLHSNPILQFQYKYAVPFIGTMCFIVPTLIPMYFWGETLINAWHVNMFRYIMNLNVTWCVNSVAHMWGYRPYDKNIRPSQNVYLSTAALGEGFHNYHHAFPWDYRTAELGNNRFNLTALFIDFFAWIGWAYDLKTAPQNVIESRSKRTGDGTDLWGNKAF